MSEPKAAQGQEVGTDREERREKRQRQRQRDEDARDTHSHTEGEENMRGSSIALRSAHSLDLTFSIPVSKVSRFWKGLEGGRVLTTKCGKCGRLSFPPQADCPACLSSEPVWVELGEEAELEAFSQVMVPPASFSDKGPYTVVVGRMKEGVKVLAWLTGADPSSLRVGMKLRLLVKREPARRPRYEFVPF